MSTETLSQALLCELSVLGHHVKKGGADVKIGMGANHYLRSLIPLSRGNFDVSF
jgi:hypothetical protein